MDQFITDLLKPTFACLQGAAPCPTTSTRFVAFAAVVLFFMAATVVFVAVKELLKEKSKALSTLAALVVLVAATIALPSALPFLAAFAIILVAIFAPPLPPGSKLWPWKIRPEIALIGIVPAIYFAVYAVEHAVTPAPSKLSAILIIADPEAVLLTDDNRDDVIAAVSLTRNKVIGSFREFELLPPDLNPYLAKAWREVGQILDSQGLSSRYAIEFAIGGSVSASGNQVHAALRELPPGGGVFVPIENPLISVEGTKERLPAMIDLLAYRIARRILALQSADGGATDRSKEEAVVTRFVTGIKALTAAEIAALPGSAGAKLDGCKDFTCADEIAVSLTDWLRPQLDPDKVARAAENRATASKSVELLGQ